MGALRGVPTATPLVTKNTGATMHTKTFDLGTDNLLTDEPAVVEWMKAQTSAPDPTP